MFTFVQPLHVICSKITAGCFIVFSLKSKRLYPLIGRMNNFLVKVSQYHLTDNILKILAEGSSFSDLLQICKFKILPMLT